MDQHEKDVAATPPKSGNQEEEFFTPLSIPETMSLPSPVAEEPEHEDSSSEQLARRIITPRRRLFPADSQNSQILKISVQNVSLAAQIFEGFRLEPPTPEKKHSMLTRLDVAVKTPTLSLRNRNFVRSHMKRSRKSPSAEGPPAKFRGLAEQIYNFFNDTPPRFRRSPVKPNPIENPAKEKVSRLTVTVPHSPQLLTRSRARSRSPPSPQPEETHLIKPARPVNPKVFRPHSCKPAPKPTTVPQPFNLTTFSKKEVSLTTADLYTFKARPVPRSCRLTILSVSSTSSGATNGVRRVAVFTEGSDAEIDEGRSLTPRPLSFDMRDRMQKNKKKIEMLIEEATKLTAPQAPSEVLSSPGCSRFHSHPEFNKTPSPFKAKPATVLSKEPFTPKPSDAPLTEIKPFQLHTERRAKERAQYESERISREQARREKM